jgi:hypothetical protein
MSYIPGGGIQGGIMGTIAGGPVGGILGGYGLGKVGDWLGQPMRSGGEYDGVNQGNYNLPGFEERRQRLLGYADGAGSRAAPQAADSNFRNQQRSVMDKLNAVMGGQDSFSREQLRQNADANIAQQRSLAATARPSNSAMMARVASQNIGNLNQGLAGQQALAGIAERLGAANALGGLSSTARGQDIGLNQFNANAQLQQGALNDEMLGRFAALELQNAGMQQAGGMGYEQNRLGRYGIRMGTPANWEGVLSAASGLGQMAMMGG